jgi:hypothetical protein
MAAASAAALNDFPEPNLTDLRSTIKALRRTLGSAGGGAGVSEDRLKLELDRFRKSGVLPDARSARLVCWGTTIPAKPYPSLIEDPERFRPLIDQVDEFRTSPRPYRRCWRGLLDGYLRYDPEGDSQDGRRNWLILRDYLHDNLSRLDRGGQLPDWLMTIDQHANVLTGDPCGRYGAALLSGAQEVIEPLRRDLSAGDSSWLGRALFEAQIDAAVALEDRPLRGIMGELLELIAAHTILADRALARVLDRYAASSDVVIDPGLRDAAVERWGNPWLERNETRWTLVNPSTRAMVSSWLKLHLMEDFFRLLSEDGVNDQRRLVFWKEYVDRITDMYFALGDAAYLDSRPDFKLLRQSMKGRLLRLESAGAANNNAFIMRIGQHMFVEFGEKGNAMFAFDIANLPFDLGRHYIAGNKSALKHPSNVARIVHNDASEPWERKAQRVIDDLARGGSTGRRQPMQPAFVQNLKPTNPGTAASRFGQSAAVKPPSASNSVDPAVFLSNAKIRFSDQRAKGGALWAYAPQHGPLADDLKKSGFAWSARRGAWYLKS